METRAHYVLIGAFVLSAVALAFLFILWLGQTQREFDEYDVIFTDRVSGLSVGAAVRFNGIQKGEVRELNIDPDDPSIVVARIRVDNDTPVKTDTRAELELVGFTGLAVIQLVGGSPDAPLLKDVQRGIPRIRADASGFAAIIEGSSDIVAAINLLLAEDNIEAFSRIIGNIDVFTGVLAKQEDKIGESIANFAAMMEDMAEASDRLRRAADEIEKLIGNDAPATLAETREAMASIRTLADELRVVVEENRAPLSAFTEEGLAQVGPAVVEARRLMRSLDHVLREIDRDPRGYLLGESAPRYEVEP
ncbi:MlaD family protein [Amphiplicatus metriothermophilus]|uniref:Phospholipid/cholesterol/gamma-HCH transport system substrate-binding protein n=1 Tax=Amphiplicatus metriothermophilus TaxID=1519374 RepID=A0A239PQN2_9PROT|nr:MlaD family protein [Amphiplicatus metriothermophilus]MBB5518385.1 phospholipid/cholesterol/gamma-HCH transport system substrate-binding protein [Amphiplicatus metriothermophilus]SNT72450.1 phospholipid/cholesterol/gamma-HCH transport system substrate-binding protein [Amphiplicatus metriothermophilus]